MTSTLAAERPRRAHLWATTRERLRHHRAMRNLVCPVSNVRIDRNVVRTNGFITTLCLVAYVLTLSPFLIVPIGFDYVLRAMMNAPASPMTRLARRVAGLLRFPYRAMDQAPKVFASRIGVCFAMGAAVTHFVAPSVAPWLAGALAVFTTLESVFDLCVGCVVYTYIALPLFRARDAASEALGSVKRDAPGAADLDSRG